MLDRLTHNSHRVTLDGECIRKTEGQHSNGETGAPVAPGAPNLTRRTFTAAALDLHACLPLPKSFRNEWASRRFFTQPADQLYARRFPSSRPNKN